MPATQNSKALPPAVKKMGELSSASEASSMKPSMNLPKEDNAMDVVSKGGCSPMIEGSLWTMAKDNSLYKTGGK